MKKIFTLLLVICSTSVLLPQSGFNNSYLFNEKSAGMLNSLLFEDTIYVNGLVLSEMFPGQQGLLSAKFDTLGTLLDYKMHFDTLGFSADLTYTNPAPFSPRPNSK